MILHVSTPTEAKERWLKKMASEDKPGARKSDQVAQNSIWREHVKKERQMLTLNENFRLNPKSLTVSSPGPPSILLRKADGSGLL